VRWHGWVFLCYATSKSKWFFMFVTSKLKTLPDPAIVIASRYQLNDLVRFCASLAGVESCVTIVDPMFKLWEFECTPTTLWSKHECTRHIQYCWGQYSFTYYSINISALFISFSCIAKELQCLRVFGSDGEKTLIDAFVHEFRLAIYLFCSTHVRNNV